MKANFLIFYWRPFITGVFLIAVALATSASSALQKPSPLFPIPSLNATVNLIQKTIVPDCAVGTHTAALHF